MTVRDSLIPVRSAVIDRLQQSPETFYNFFGKKMNFLTFSLLFIGEQLKNR